MEIVRTRFVLHVCNVQGDKTGLALIVEDDALFQPFTQHFAQMKEIADIPHMPSGVCPPHLRP
jgi:hypothetical protein